MPWTFAHPAAIVPLRRFFLDDRLIVGLAMGSLVPDLAYYVLGQEAGRLGTLAHSLNGWWLLDAPVGACLSWLFIMGRTRLAAPLPQPYRRALLALRPGRWADARLWAWLMLASGMGAATHLLWDAFTHASGFFVQHWPLLRRELGLLDGRPWLLFNALQHLSTLFGLGVLWRLHARWRRLQGAPAAVAPDGRSACLLGAVLLSAVFGALLTMPQGPWQGALHPWAVRGVIRASVLFAAAYALLAWWWGRR